jgi:hypothetical protein
VEEQLFHVDGRMHVTNVTVAFRKFANTPKDFTLWAHIAFLCFLWLFEKAMITFSHSTI